MSLTLLVVMLTSPRMSLQAVLVYSFEMLGKSIFYLFLNRTTSVKEKKELERNIFVELQ